MIEFTILCTFVSLLFLVYRRCLLRFYRRYVFAKSVPGPGILELVRLDRKKGGRFLEWCEHNRQRYGSVCRIWLGTHLVVQVTDPDLVREILSSNEIMQKGHAYDVLHPWLKQGLLTHIGGAEYTRKRKMLTPAFHFKVLSQFKPLMDECCEILCQQLSKVADGSQTINLYDYTGRFTLDVIYETAMGMKMNIQLNKDSEILKATEKLCHILHYQMFGSWTRIPFLFNISKFGRERDAAITVLHNETRRVVKLRRDLLDADFAATTNGTFKKTGNTDDGDENNLYLSSKRRLAFLDVLLLSQREGALLTNENILEEVNTVMFGGHDTISATLAFVLYSISQDERVQQCAYEEAVELGPLQDANQSRPYLEAIIKETMRLYPAAPFYSRQIENDYQMGKWTVPAGASVMVATYTLQRDPKLYKDPNRFWPERFLEEEDARSTHAFAHIPFSAGPRNCIGQRFATLELKCTITRLLRQFNLLPAVGFVPSLVPQIVLTSVNGLKVRLRQRQ